MRAIAASDVDMRLGVGRTPLLGQLLENRLGVAVAQLGAGVAARRALSENVDRSVKPDRDRTLVEQLARGGIDIGASAGGDHSNIAFDETSDQPPLAVAKVALAVALEDFSCRIAGRVLDLSIAVDKGQAETLGQAP